MGAEEGARAENPGRAQSGGLASSVPWQPVAERPEGKVTPRAEASLLGPYPIDLKPAAGSSGFHFGFAILD